MPSNQNRDNFIDKAFTVIAESIVKIMPIAEKEKKACLLYTSDAADDSLRVDLGGRRIIKKTRKTS